MMDKEREMFIGISACSAYCVSSILMTFINKAIFSIFEFNFPLSLLLYQYVFTVIIVGTGRVVRIVEFNALDRSLMKAWYPANVLFLLMLMTSSYALKYLSVPMVTIFKNLTTTLVAIGDFYFLGQTSSSRVFACILVMVFASIIAGFNDLNFNFIGYVWMMCNCFVSAGYILYMRLVINTRKPSDWQMVFYNNLLAIPLVLPLILSSGEVPMLFSLDSSFFTTQFVITFILNGISSVLISASSFWAVKTTSPTTYSIVGTLNKIPLTILSFFVFDAPVNTLGAVGISLSLGAGVAYSIFKLQDMNNSKKVSLPSSPRDVDMEKASDPDFSRKIEEEVKPLVLNSQDPKISHTKGYPADDSDDDL